MYFTNHPEIFKWSTFAAARLLCNVLTVIFLVYLGVRIVALLVFWLLVALDLISNGSFKPVRKAIARLRTRRERPAVHETSAKGEAEEKSLNLTEDLATVSGCGIIDRSHISG
jgi:hypothetical protein